MCVCDSANFVIVATDPGLHYATGASSTAEQTIARTQALNDFQNSLKPTTQAAATSTQTKSMFGVMDDPNYQAAVKANLASAPTVTPAEQAADDKRRADLASQAKAAAAVAAATQSQSVLVARLQATESLPLDQKVREQQLIKQQMDANARVITRRGADPDEADRLVDLNQAAVTAQQAVVEAARRQAAAAAAQQQAIAQQNGRAGTTSVLDAARAQVIAHEQQVAQQQAIAAAYEANRAAAAAAAAKRKAAAAGALQP